MNSSKLYQTDFLIKVTGKNSQIGAIFQLSLFAVTSKVPFHNSESFYELASLFLLRVIEIMCKLIFGQTERFRRILHEFLSDFNISLFQKKKYFKICIYTQGSNEQTYLSLNYFVWSTFATRQISVSQCKWIFDTGLIYVKNSQKLNIQINNQ